MTTRPFHHGNLRAVLLEQAESMLRATGTDGLSLRELARQAGVSHGAPRSHFIDRQALLDALAERGFDRLTRAVRSALDGAASARVGFDRVADAYVDFAIEDAALMELMFAAKTSARPGAVQDAAGRLFGALDDTMGPSGPDADETDRDTFTMLFGATMQGIAALVASGRIARAQGDVLVAEAMAMLLDSELGGRVVTRR
jgi:AcrR family transcriptional regulator